MTIDEAIMIEKYYGKKDEKALKELQNNFPMIEGITDNNLHEQIAEWLEELRANKVTSAEIYESGYKRGYQAGYTKAVQDFVDKVEFVVGAEDRDIYCKEIVKEVAEHLKEGVE